MSLLPSDQVIFWQIFWLLCGIVMAANWPQLVPAYDLIARPTTFTSASGANVAVAGSNLGGIGQVPAKGYKPTR